jgi:hypothetical protein
MTVFVNINNTKTFEKYLLPENTDTNNTHFVEITIDYTSDLFVAKKIKDKLKITDEWQEYNDFTFPSSLLRKFLHSDIAT